MAEEAADIVLVEKKSEPAELARLVGAYFESMVKHVALIGQGEPLP